MTSVNETSYESFADDYLSTSNERYVLSHYERPYILSQLPVMKNCTVLDVGCASGFYSKYCQNQGAKVICIDASQKMVEHTLQLCNGKAEGHVHDMAKPMNFARSSSVDVIICSLILHYLEKWDGVLSEFYRILKEGGKCVISTHHPINDYTRFNQENYFRTRLIEVYRANGPF
jgi:SAM-dependent methyltransferase